MTIFTFTYLQGKYFDAEIPGCKKNTLSTFRYNSIINFLALTLTMSRHAVKVSNQGELTHREINVDICEVPMCGKRISWVCFYDGSKNLKMSKYVI